jgi:hypothetical protein
MHWLQIILDLPIIHSIIDFLGPIATKVVSVVIGTIIAMIAGWFAWLELPGRLTARAVSRGNPYRLNILIARFAGEGSQDIKDRIVEQLNEVFGDVASRPFEIIHFPLTLRMPESGKDSEIPRCQKGTPLAQAGARRPPDLGAHRPRP